MPVTGEAGPLQRIRVLDLTTFLSGPYCTQILGDLGAEVIKVEHPEGDLTRKLPPHFVGDDSAYFLSTNRNKKSVVIDLKHPDGQKLVNALAAESDVLIENFRPTVIGRLGLDYAALSEKHPKLVWCSLSGFGQDGPYRDLPAYDMVIQAISGIMSLTGEPGRPGVRTGIPLSDLIGGMYAAIAILAALQERAQSGRGQQIDISLLDCVTSLLSYQGVYHLVSGIIPGRQGRGHDSIPTYRTYTASDGEDVTITANTERMWRALCQVVGKPELVEDPRFATLDVRHQHREELWALLEAQFRTRPSQEWVALLRAAEVPAATVNTVDRTLNDPHVLHRRMVLALEGPDGQPVRLLGNPVKYSRSNQHKHRYPPRLGEDTVAVLTELLALPANEVERLAAAGVIAGERSQPAE
jgi:crotonobetainyl-CoA:carnitine CoA-transferase CaiB-like acyl-CoA transferase